MSGELLGAVVRGVVSAAINTGLSLVTKAITEGLHDATPKKLPPNALLEVANQNSAYGIALTKGWGKYKLAGNIIWAETGIRYYAEQESNYSRKAHAYNVYDIARYYKKALAISLGELQVTHIHKIWADDVLIYDASLDYTSKINSPGDDVLGGGKIGSGIQGPGFILYDGTQTLPDPTMEAHIGVGNTPAYTGQSYVVLPDYALSKFENASGLYQPDPTAVVLPTFSFLVDAEASTIHSYSAARNNTGYTASYNPVIAGVPIYEQLYRSPFRLTELANDVTTWVDGQALNSYVGIKANINALAAAYPTKMLTEVIGQSFTGLDILCARLFDNGTRPIFGISQGIHGDERDTSWAVEKFLELALTSTDPVYQYLRDHFAIYVVATMNPDGMASPAASTWGGTGTRNNGNNVNLNRNWPYYWETVTDVDKGASPASEPETQAVINWLTLHKPKRIKFWVDVHGQNSRNDFAMFCEQIYHDWKTQRIQRSGFNYANGLLKRRVLNPGLTFNPAGFGSLFMNESRSRRKPYIYTWIQQYAVSECFGCIVEYPQIESTGLVNTGMMDILKGFAAGACDAIQSESGGYAILPPYAPINNNSLFASWNSVEKRPTFFSANGLRLSYFPDGERRTRPFVRSFRPDDIGWPVNVAGAGYCVTQDGLSTDQFLVCAGYNLLNELPTLSGENLDTGAKTTNEQLPVSVRDGAMCWHDGHVYFSGGFDLSANTYSSAIYRASSIPDAQGDIGGWTLYANMPTGLQRHQLCSWGGYLVISGGRDSVGYKTGVLLFNVATKAFTTLANLTVARGWHTAAVYSDTLFVFGGWTGGSTLTSVEKINLNTGAVSAGTNLINSRAEQAIAVNDNLAYLIAGRTGSTTIQNDVWAYDMAADTVTNLPYTTQQSDEPGHEDGPNLPDPFVRSAAAFYHPVDGYIGIVGGVDSSGLIGARVWEFHPENAEMYIRQTDALTWGYLRTTTTHTGVAGDQFSLNVALRNADDPNEVRFRNPYVRLTAIIGPLSSPQRKIRSGYFVPPQDSFRTYTIPFELQPGETEFRIYLRHYGGGTSVDIGAMQVVKALTTGFIVPQEGGGGGSLSMTFRTPLNAADTLSGGKWNLSRSASGTFSCIFGSQQNKQQKIFSVDLAANSYVKLIEVWYEAAEDFSGGIPINPAYPDLVAFPSTGKLYLKYQLGTGAVQTEDIFPVGNFDLNHARLSREWRLDVVDWSINSLSGDSWMEFSFYGLYKRVDFVGPNNPIHYVRNVFVELSGTYERVITFDITDGVYNIIDTVITTLAHENVRKEPPPTYSMLAKEFAHYGINAIGITCDNTGVIMSVSRTLQTVVSQICQDAGFSPSEIDTTQLTGNLIGYASGQITTARALLDPLRAAFAFDMIESGGKLKFISRNRVVSPLVIDESDLIPMDKAVLKIASRQEAEMPRKLSVSYIDPAMTYQQNTQTASMDNSRDIATDSALSLPLVLNATDAMNIAETLLAASWKGRFNYSFRTTYKWIHLEPTDVVTVNVNGIGHTLLLTGKQISPSGYIEYTGDQYSTSAYDHDAVGTPGPVDNQTITLRKPTLWQLLDIPIFQEVDNNAGFYAALYNDPDASGKWGGASLAKSNDNVIYTAVASNAFTATTGTCATILGDAKNVNIWDESNTVDVTVFSGAAFTKTKAEILNGDNAVLIGNEIIQFTTITLVSGDTYRLSGLLRGRLDTPATGHIAGERAILLSGDGIARVSLATNEIGILKYYRGVTVNADIDAVSPTSFACQAAGLKPFAPCHIKGNRDSSGNLAIEFKRRTRFNGGWVDNIDVPLNEASESYTLRIMNGTTVKRTFNLTSPSATYTSAQQITDFGSNQATVSVQVWQNSAVVGAGNIAAAII